VSKQIRLFFTFLLYFLFVAQPAKAQVIISELYPNPDTTETEWLEIYNTSDQPISLANWQIWDQLSKPSKIYQFTETEQLASGEYLTISLKSILNNSGDTVILYNNQQVIQDSLTYTSSTKGLSWSKKTNNLTEIFATEPSPNAENIFIEPTNPPAPTPTLTISPTSKPPAKTSSQITTISPTTTPIIIEEKSSPLDYPKQITQPLIDLPKENIQALQSIFYEPPNLEIGAINVIIGSLLLLIPGIVYAKKQTIF